MHKKASKYYTDESQESNNKNAREYKSEYSNQFESVQFKPVNSVVNLEEEAILIENENYIKANKARIQLEGVLSLQDSTNLELKRQGETILQMKKTAFKILENSKVSCETELKIKEEKSIFPSFSNYFNKVKRWWVKNVKMEKEIEEMKKASSNNFKEVNVVSSEMDRDNNSNLIASSPFELVKNEMIPGENKVISEFQLIYESLKKINKNGRNQIEIVKEQKKDVKDISKLGEFASEFVNETEKQMNSKN
jgi:hypothetical protein